VDEQTGAIVEALRARRIHAMRAVARPDWRGVTVGMAVDELERFLDTIIHRPITEDDGLEMRIFGRAQDLGPTDEAWQFDLVPGLSQSELIRMHVYVLIPAGDVGEVLARLRAVDPSD